MHKHICTMTTTTSMLTSDATVLQLLERMQIQTPPQPHRYSKNDYDTESILSPPSQVQMYYSQWRERLHHIATRYHNNNNIDSSMTTAATTNTTNHHNVVVEPTTDSQSWQQIYTIQSAYYMELYQLEQELQPLRELLSVLLLLLQRQPSSHPTNNKNENEKQSTTLTDWISSIPMVQDEIFKCQEMLHPIRTNSQNRQTNPTDTTNVIPFRFYKYRWQQQQQQQHRSTATSSSTSLLLQPLPSSFSSESSSCVLEQAGRSTSTAITIDHDTSNNRIDLTSCSTTTIEGCTHQTILVHVDGTVQYLHLPPPQQDADRTMSQRPHVTHAATMNGKDRTMVNTLHHHARTDNTSTEQMPVSPLPPPPPRRNTSQTIVIRNIQHCHIQLMCQYKSIYFVNVDYTSIHLYHPVLGAIHVTDCNSMSFMEGVQAQQLRLHHSQYIQCDNVHIQAGTILEDCEHVTFRVPPKTDMAAFRSSIKDFNWLRNGMVSPNFTIQMYDPTPTSTSATILDGDPSMDHGMEERPNPSKNSNASNDNGNRNDDDDDNDDDDEI